MLEFITFRATCDVAPSCSECASNSINREEALGRHALVIGRLFNLVLIRPAEKAPG